MYHSTHMKDLEQSDSWKLKVEWWLSGLVGKENGQLFNRIEFKFCKM